MKKSLVRPLFAALAAATLLPLSACGSSDDSASGGSDTTTLTVFAAASLTDTFTEIKKEFEAAHPGVDVKLDFDGSSTLVSQIQGGAPADVFASADTANMDKLTQDGSAQAPKDFATNVLEIATPPDNPAHITSFADLGKSGVKVVVCAPEVPCGAATQQMEQKTGVTIKPVSEEQSVTDVLGKITSGEADAGLVYVTDVTSAGDQVKGVPFPQSSKVVNTYPIATLKDAKNADLAEQFVDFVLGSDGQKVLKNAGFGQP
ncbi:molybdate ABC transporter substrate-binding protein [Nocardioides sp. DS6]|uniref:Molybdate ABC transporter substrate-binding protein n=1 Tax=Nocardioides eburneus TaxID=3231482 RepID=A0ABV3T178_9ACTN